MHLFPRVLAPDSPLMPPHADELEPLASDIALWRCYDPNVKADLFSTAIGTPHGVVVIDPIPMTEDALRALETLGTISAIAITNANHVRAATEFAGRFSTPAYAHADAVRERLSGPFQPVADSDRICEALDVIAIDGAATGEIALHHSANGGTLVVGDALIHCDPYGFAFLPPKYCANTKAMKRSLRKLLEFPAERILFAHGLPILSRAMERLQSLLDS